MCNAVFDNDICAKSAAYDLLTELLGLIESDPNSVGVLGAARFVLPKLNLGVPAEQVEAFRARLGQFLDTAITLEPSDEERELALRFEETAQEIGAQLDFGESQLFAIACLRCIRTICTGDKRAIRGLEAMLSHVHEVSKLENTVLSLEWIVFQILKSKDFDLVASKIRLCPDVDAAMKVCFGCEEKPTSEADATDGLKSYLAETVETAPTMLRS